LGKKKILGEVRDCLRTSMIGGEIFHYEEIGSTNEEAAKLANMGGREGAVVLADRQRFGRGRLGRRWHSPQGGLWFSVILRPKIEMGDAPKLTLIASVAIAKAIQEFLELNVDIKWPNDILIDGRKVCGILTEASSKDGELDYIILGVGINVDFEEKEFPLELRSKAVTLRNAYGKKIDISQFLCYCLRKIETYYIMFQDEGFDFILKEWKSLASIMGREIEIRRMKEKLSGTAIDVDKHGALILQLRDGTCHRILSGEILSIELPNVHFK